MQNKIYSLKFSVDNFESEIKLTEGELPGIPKDSPSKNGFNLLWLNSDKPVFSDTELRGIWVKDEPEHLLWALRNPLLGYSADSSEFGSGIISAALTQSVTSLTVPIFLPQQLFRSTSVRRFVITRLTRL